MRREKRNPLMVSGVLTMKNRNNILILNTKKIGFCKGKRDHSFETYTKEIYLLI